MLLIGFIFGLTAAGPPLPAGKKKPAYQVGGEFDAPTAKAIKEAGIEQATDDKTLSPKALEDKQKKLTQLDSFVQDRAEKHPESLAVQRTASHYSLQRGDFKTAGTRADQALALATPEGDPKLTAEMLVVRGTAKYQQGDIPGAAADGRAAVEFDPKNRAAVELTKYTEGRGPRVEEGVEAAKDSENVSRMVARQAPISPHTPQEWANDPEKVGSPCGQATLAAIESRKNGDNAQALQHSESAVRADPQDPMAYFQRGRSRKDLGDNNGAVLDLTQSIKLGWDDPVLFTARADALMKAGGRERAQAAFHDADMAVRLDPKQAGAYMVRSAAGLSVGRPVDAILADLKMAAELDAPRYGAFYDQQRPILEKLIADGHNRKAGAVAAAKGAVSQPQTGAAALGGFEGFKRRALGTGRWGGLAVGGLGLSLLAFAVIGLARK